MSSTPLAARAALAALLICSGAAHAAPPVVVASPFKPAGRDGGVTLDQNLRTPLAALSDIRIPAFPLAPGRAPDLILHRFEVLAPDARVIDRTDSGEVDAVRPDVQLWRGEISDEPGSSVYLSLSPFGASGYVRSAGSTYIISGGPGERHPIRITDLAVENAAVKIRTPLCAGAIRVPGAPPPRVSFPTDSSPPWPCRRFRLAIECDYEFTQSLFAGNSTASKAYAVTLLGAISEIYQRDMNVSVQVGYIRAWTTANDPYTAANTGDELGEFRDYWIANMGGVDRDLTHLLSGRALGGGVAFVSTTCSTDYGYAVSADLGGYFPYPLRDHSSQNWDVHVVAHEMGHNLGSLHTHDPAQYVPPIDGCGAAYLSPPQTQDCSQAWNGTIMSYCHICPGGETNINLTMGPRVAAVIRGYLDGSVPTCGTYPAPSISGQPVAVTASINAPVAFQVNADGTAPLSYQWRRNGVNVADGPRITGSTAATLSINPVKFVDAGAYDVLVTDQCGQVVSTSAGLAVLAACYANCDGSTTPPIVNISDFACFMSRFAAGDSYANCDGSTLPPLLTVNDFVCFQSAFAAGCP